MKQVLLSKQIRVEAPGESYGLISTTGLQPEPIPLDLKIVLIGERSLYNLLGSLDHEFEDLFKVAADFDACAHLVAASAREQGMLSFSRSAVERVVEERSREAGDSERLSTRMLSLNDLIFQANFCATQRQAELVQ